MTRKSGSLAVLIAVALSSLLAAGGASAKSIRLPVVHQVAQASVVKPNGVAYDFFAGEVWVSSVGPPPRLEAFSTTDFTSRGHINLPDGSEPGSIVFGPDGYLYVIDHAQNRVFVVNVDSGEIVDNISIGTAADFLTGYVDGYKLGPALFDFGNSFSAGALLFGGAFGMRLAMPDTITPNGGAILPDISKPAKGRISDEILIADAENNHLVRFSDAPTPGLLGTISLPGNPGLQPPRDVDVNPLNLNPNVAGPAVHPVFVAFPDLGIYESLGPNGPWTQVPATGIGRPTQVASDCDTVGATSFSQNLVTFFDVTEPKGSHCEDFVELLLNPKSGIPITFAGAVKSYVDGGGDVAAAFGEKPRSASAVKSKKKKKLKLTAGRLTKFKTKLPSGVAAALRNRHKAVITVKIRIKSSTGRSAVVTRRVRIRSH